MAETEAGPDGGGGTGRPPVSMRWWLGSLCCAAAMVTAYFLLPLDGLGPNRPALGWTLFTLSLTLVALLLLAQIGAVLAGDQAPPRPHPSGPSAASRRGRLGSSYRSVLNGNRPGTTIPLLMCLAVLVFAAGYYVMAKHPGQMSGLHTRLDALYFTTVTLATVGYGDIVPVGQTARVVVIVQILYTFVFLTAAATALTRYLRARVTELPRRHPR
jgi:voltage-gated potassium channel